MRLYIILLFLGTTILTSCQQSGAAGDGKKEGTLTGAGNNAAKGPLTTIAWKEKTINYGKIKEGEKLNVEFKFTNTGKQPLVISRVEPSCGCTVAEIPKEPIQPGKEGSIHGSFDSNGRSRTQHKTLLVYSNAEGVQPSELSFEVEVEPKN
ncbi:MAG: DUF1573 domain-containing protein [Williamsia sp.]|nr:DUF1573 domain-containing protein [Williamsia sp.]